MKKETKKRLKENLLDAILEIILGLACFAIGIGVFALFGKEMDDIDFDIAFLVGLGVIVAISIVVFLIVRSVRKSSKRIEENDGISPLNKDN